MTHDTIPSTYSLPRITTLLVSLLVALGSGTNYVSFNAQFSPHFGAEIDGVVGLLRYVTVLMKTCGRGAQPTIFHGSLRTANGRKARDHAHSVERCRSCWQ